MDLTNEQFWAIDEAVKRDEAWENRKEAVQGIVSRIIIPIVCATQLETENPSTNTHIRVCSTCGKRVYYDNGNCSQQKFTIIHKINYIDIYCSRHSIIIIIINVRLCIITSIST